MGAPTHNDTDTDNAMHVIYVQINERAARRTPYASIDEARQKDPSGVFFTLLVTSGRAPLAQPLSVWL